MRRKKRIILLVSLGLILIPGLILYRMMIPGTIFLKRFMDRSLVADRSGEPFEVRRDIIERAGRRIPVKVFQPVSGHDRALLLIHGVHFGGYDEPRLVFFSERLAGMGFAVVTPDIADLKGYEIVTDALDDIEQSALWLLDESGLVSSNGDGRIGLLGISFSGGLCLSAAGREPLRERIAFVFSFGGHADLDRTMEYLATGRLPGGELLPPHVYGQAVLLRMFADRLVPAEQVDSLRQALLVYLHEKFEQAEKELDSLAPESRALVALCLERDTDRLGEILLPQVRAASAHPSLSPVRGSPPDCTIFLLHGSVDNVIPPSETLELEKWASRSTDTTALISTLIRHVEIEETDEEPTLADYWDVIRFWTELLRS